MRILILEDDPLIALDLEMLLTDDGHTVIGICDSLDEARPRLADSFDFALLDIDLRDGKSFEIATALEARNTPFSFLSASRQSELPCHLQGAPFMAKPYQRAALIAQLQSRRSPCA